MPNRLTFVRLLRNPADYDLTLAAETVRLQLASARVTSRHIVAGLDALRPPAAG